MTKKLSEYFYKKETKDKFIKLMEKRYSFENDVLKTIEKNHPNATDTKRKQIFKDWLFPKAINKEDSNEP